MLTQEGELPNLPVVSSENEVKGLRKHPALFAIQIQHTPDRRLWARFHNRAEDDTSFAAQ